jgi:hypothetical protein
MIVDFIINFEECYFLICLNQYFSHILLYSGYCAFRSTIKRVLLIAKYLLIDRLLHIYMMKMFSPFLSNILQSIKHVLKLLFIMKKAIFLFQSIRGPTAIKDQFEALK